MILKLLHKVRCASHGESREALTVTYRVRQIEQFPCQSLLWVVRNVPAGFHASARCWEETAVTQSPFELGLYRNESSI